MSEPLTLALDASTYRGTTAVIRGSSVLAALDVPMRTPDRETLLPAVASMLDALNVAPRHIERVVCGSGPGSFTSLRIAASIAKGIAFGAGASLFAVPSLLLMVAGNDIADQPGCYVATLDALRGELYAAAMQVGAQGELTELAPAAVMSYADAQALALRLSARIVGALASETPALIPHARGVARLHATLDRASPEELTSWEPSYGRQAEAQARWERQHGRPLAGA